MTRGACPLALLEPFILVRTELYTMQMSHTMDSWTISEIREQTDRQTWASTGPGAKSAIYDCLVWAAVGAVA